MNPQASQMDNDVINLAKAIRQTESGGDFNAKGASGESGAYQWTAPTWKAHAGTVLGNPNAEMTPSNQNAVAYKMLKTWKDQGLNPAQIAAKWNSGSEVGWENKRGTNSYGVQYDVPRYVKSVTDAYQQVKGGVQVGMDPNNPSSTAGATMAPEVPQEGGGIKGFFKSLISAPATMLARPVQAVQSGIQLAATDFKGMEAEAKKYSDEAYRLSLLLKTTPEGYQQDQLKAQIQAQQNLAQQASDRLGKAANWKPSAGGIVAEAPENFADVKKDVGRGIQTAAFGLGPVSGGAAFGAGYSLEQGNDLLSLETAFSTVLGAAGGKVLDLIGKPLLDASGKVIGKITPEVLKAVAGKGAQAIVNFAAQHEILPGVVSRGINKGADLLERGANAPFKAGGKVVKAPFVQNDEKVIANRERALQDLEEKYSQLRANVARDPVGTAASRGRVSRSNVLTEEGMINEDGVIIGAIRASEAYERDAIGQGNRVVRELLDREGVAIDIETQLRAELERVARETFDGAELTKALKNVEKEVRGLRIKRQNGRMTLTDVHKNKISSRPKGKDYDDPLKSKMKKAISRGYKETVEKYSKENVEAINKELQKFYDDAEYIANLQGKRIESGKLGKAVARVGGAVSGAVIGGALGGLPGVAAGSYVGGMVSSKLAGRSLQKAFGKPTKFVTPKSKVIGEAVAKANAPRNQLMLPAPKGKTPIPLQPPKGKPSLGVVKAPSYVDRDPKTGKFRKVFLSSDAPQVSSKMAEKAYESTVANGGITISLKGDTPVAGLAYAPFKGTERVIPKKDFTPKHLDTYIDDHFDELSQSGNHLGTWEFEGNVYMDVSKVGPNTPETKELAVKANQLGVFDLESFETIELGKLQDGRYIRTYAKETNLSDFNGGQNKGANKGGGVGELSEVRGGEPKISGGSTKKASDVGGKVKEETVYHGTSAKFTSLKGNKDGLVYVTVDPNEAKLFSENPIVGGGKGEGESRVLELKAKAGKTKNVTDEVTSYIFEEDPNIDYSAMTLDDVVREEAKRARSQGYRYIEFEHPSSLNSDKNFTAKVSLFPEEDLIEVPKVGKVGEIGKPEKFQYKQFGKQLRKQIDRDLVSNKSKAVIVDSDSIKKAHPDYDPDRPDLLHTESSALSKDLLNKAIDEDTSGIFRMTGGGAGSGKSEAVLKRIKSQPSVIFDGVLGDFESAVKKIDYALLKGKRVEIYPVYSPIELATTFNRSRVRKVPSDKFVNGHFGFRDTIPQLMEKYGNRIKVKPYENVRLGVKPKKLSQKQGEAKAYVDSMKMSQDEIAKRNERVNRLIDKHGIDWTKEHINGILDSI